MTAAEKARQIQKNNMELNKTERSRSKTIQVKKYPESNKCIDAQPQQNIDFNLVEQNEKDGMFFFYNQN